MTQSDGKRPPLVAPWFMCDELFRFHSPKPPSPLPGFYWVIWLGVPIVWIIWGVSWAMMALPILYGLQILMAKTSVARDNELRKARVVEPRQSEALEFSDYEFDYGYLSRHYTGGLIINDLTAICGESIDDAAKFVDAFWGYILPGEESLGRINWRYSETGEWSVIIPDFGSFKAVRGKGLTFRSKTHGAKQDSDISIFTEPDQASFQRPTHRWARPVIEGKVPLEQLSTRRRIVWFISGATGISLPRAETMLGYFLALLTEIFITGKTTINWRKRGRMQPCRAYKGKNPKTGEPVCLPKGRYYIFESDPQLFDATKGQLSGSP